MLNRFIQRISTSDLLVLCYDGVNTNNNNMTMHTRHLFPKLTAVLAIGLLATAVIVLTPALAPAKPQITWTPGSVHQTISAGSNATVPVSFTAAQNLKRIAVHISPELRPYVAVSPASFARVPKRQRINLTLTIAVPADALPQTVKGMIRLREQDDKDDKKPKDKDFLDKPLPVTVAVVWQQFNDPVIPGITFQYPNFGQPSQVDVRSHEEGIKTVDIKLLSDSGGAFVSYFKFGFVQNSNGLSLPHWFQENVDRGGYLLSAGVVTPETLSNGMEVLFLVGPVPDAHADQFDPVSTFYGISPNGGTIIHATLSHVHELDLQGFGTPKEQIHLLKAILENIQFN